MVYAGISLLTASYGCFPMSLKMISGIMFHQHQLGLMCRYAEGVPLRVARRVLLSDAEECFQQGRCANAMEAELTALRRLFGLVMQVNSWLSTCVIALCV